MIKTADKVAALVDWICTYPAIDGYIKLNAVSMESGENAVNTVQSDAVVKEFIDGSTVRHMTFSVVMVCDWPDGFDDINAAAMEWGGAFLDWVTAQNKARKFPAFPKGCEVTAVKPLNNVPALTNANAAEALGRYQFAARVEYNQAD